MRARRDATVSFLEPRWGARSRWLAGAFGARSVLSAAVRTVQTAKNLRRDPLVQVHRTKRASHDVVTPLFPLLKVFRRLSHARHALGLGGGEARARDELSRAKERAQTHGTTDGGEDGVHLDCVYARVLRQSIGRGCGMRARIGRCARSFDRSIVRSIDSFRVSVRGRVVVVVASRRVAMGRTSGLNQRWANVAPLMSSSSSSSGVRRLAFAGGRSRRISSGEAGSRILASTVRDSMRRGGVLRRKNLQTRRSKATRRRAYETGDITIVRWLRACLYRSRARASSVGVCRVGEGVVCDAFALDSRASSRRRRFSRSSFHSSTMNSFTASLTTFFSQFF